MTKRDYILIAAILFDRRETMFPAAFEELVQAFCDTLKAENPRFDAARFKEACGA